jgi:hypothetical protein
MDEFSVDEELVDVCLTCENPGSGSVEFDDGISWSIADSVMGGNDFLSIRRGDRTCN